MIPNKEIRKLIDAKLMVPFYEMIYFKSNKILKKDTQ